MTVMNILRSLIGLGTKRIKKLKSRYSLCEIDPNLYLTFKIRKGPEYKGPSVVYLPYIMEQRSETDEKTESDREYDKFKAEYYEKHECCPKCGSDSCMETLVDYILYMDKKDEYKDLNRCTCQECGNTHSRHDRVESRTKSLIDTQRKIKKLK